MGKYLVFYPVTNELGFERHTFDLMTDEEAWKELQKLEGARVYDMTRSDRNGQMLDMGDFVEDYNDEELDGGWWSIILTLPEEQDEERELIGYQIDFGEEPWPEGLFSFQVFRTKKDVEDYIFLEELGEKYYDRIVEIYRGDVEEPSFLGTRVREFGKNEVVAVHDGPSWYQAIIEAELHTEDDDETMPVFPVGSDGKCLPPVQVEAGCVYKKAPGKTCPKCGKPLYIEHNDEIDYPFFCPECDENFYGIEIQ